MIINPQENTIVVSVITEFPFIELDNGIKIYKEVYNPENLKIHEKCKVKLNISKRDRNGSFT